MDDLLQTYRLARATGPLLLTSVLPPHPMFHQILTALGRPSGNIPDRTLSVSPGDRPPVPHIPYCVYVHTEKPYTQHHG